MRPTATLGDRDKPVSCLGAAPWYNPIVTRAPNLYSARAPERARMLEVVKLAGLEGRLVMRYTWRVVRPKLCDSWSVR